MLSSIGLKDQWIRWRIPDTSRTFTANRWWAVIAATGVILAALYLLWAYQRVFHGPQNQEDEPTKDLTNWERLTLLPLIVATSFGYLP